MVSAADMRVPAAQEEAVARRMRDDEFALLRERWLHGVLFSTSGPRRRTPELDRDGGSAHI